MGVFLYIGIIFLNTMGLFVLHNKSHYLLSFNNHYLISNEKKTWKNYSIALLSNIIIGVSSLINIMYRTDNNITLLTEFDKYIYIYSISYFTYDLYNVNFIVKYKNASEYNLHHILVLYAIIYTLIYKVYSGYIIWFFTTEISTIFLNIRWFLYKCKYNNNSFESVITSISVIFTYTLFRIIQLPYAEYNFIKKYDNSLASDYYFYRQVLIFIVMYSLNMYWYYNIIKKFKGSIIKYILPKPYSIYDDIESDINL